nr:zinc finger protein 43-like [Aedes albopictus]
MEAALISRSVGARLEAAKDHGPIEELIQDDLRTKDERSPSNAHREPHIQCPRCDLAFHYKSRLLTHLRNHDRRQLKIKLEKHKKTQNKLPKKRRIVRKAEPVKCKKCDAVFRTSNYLKYHLRTMHEEPQIKCPKCEKAFHFKSRLLEHLRTHQGNLR